MYRYQPRFIIKSHLSLAIIMGLIATAFLLWTTLSQPSSLQSATPAQEVVSAETTETVQQVTTSRDRIGKRARGLTAIITPSDVTSTAAFGQLFDASESFSSFKNREIVEYRWEVSAGNTVLQNNGSSIAVLFTTTGTHTVTVTVVDGRGNTASATATIEATEPTSTPSY